LYFYEKVELKKKEIGAREKHQQVHIKAKEKILGT